MSDNLIDFRMTGGSYEHDVHIVVTSDIKEARKIIEKDCEFKLVENAFGVRAFCLSEKGHVPVIWLPKPPRTVDDLSTFGHEVFHLTCTLMSWAGIPLSSSSEEAYTHQFKYLFKNILLTIRKHERRNKKT